MLIYIFKILAHACAGKETILLSDPTSNFSSGPYSPHILTKDDLICYLTHDLSVLNYISD